MAKNTTENGVERPHNILKDTVLKKEDGGILPEKVFVARNSYLRELYKNDFVKSWYHISGAQVLTILVYIIVEDLTADSREMGTLDLLKIEFQGFHIALLVWTVIFLATLLIFYLFKTWAIFRAHINNNKMLKKVWDYFWVTCVPCYYFLILYATARAVILLDLSFLLTVTLMIESVRLLMKTHSFIRSSAAEVIKYKPHSDMSAPEKKFSSFLCFLFCPTLLYRDIYPRTTHIRWIFVGKCILELLVCTVLMTYMLKSFCLQPLAGLGMRPYKWKDILLIFFKFTLVGPLLVFASFCFVLDSWHNMFAELTMFADRLFYKDWWNSTDYLRFYKTWNLVVHDWLYEYVYKDMYIYVTPRNKVIARVTVFLISAIFHEVIIYVSLQMFFPILLIMFLFPGTLLTFVRVGDHYIWHILFLYQKFLGHVLLLSLYTMEYTAKNNSNVL